MSAGRGYRRDVGLVGATAVVAGSMVGSGIFSAIACGDSEAGAAEPRRLWTRRKQHG